MKRWKKKKNSHRKRTWTLDLRLPRPAFYPLCYQWLEFLNSWLIFNYLGILSGHLWTWVKGSFTLILCSFMDCRGHFQSFIWSVMEAFQSLYLLIRLLFWLWTRQDTFSQFMDSGGAFEVFLWTLMEAFEALY